MLYVTMNHHGCVQLLVFVLSLSLQYVHNLMPRGQYTSGKGSSAVGLTAYVTRDPDTRQLVLQTYVLERGGVKYPGFSESVQISPFSCLVP